MKVYVITVKDYDSCQICGMPDIVKVVSSVAKACEETDKLQKEHPHVYDYEWESFEVK